MLHFFHILTLIYLPFVSHIQFEMRQGYRHLTTFDYNNASNQWSQHMVRNPQNRLEMVIAIPGKLQ